MFISLNQIVLLYKGGKLTHFSQFKKYTKKLFLNSKISYYPAPQKKGFFIL